MTAPTAAHSHYLICLSPECEVFPVRATDPSDEGDVPADRTWEPVGPGPDAGPEGCLTNLVADGELPDGARLGHWHTASDDAIVGYWTIETT